MIPELLCSGEKLTEIRVDSERMHANAISFKRIYNTFAQRMLNWMIKVISNFIVRALRLRIPHKI